MFRWAPSAAHSFAAIMDNDIGSPIFGDSTFSLRMRTGFLTRFSLAQQERFERLGRIIDMGLKLPTEMKETAH